MTDHVIRVPFPGLSDKKSKFYLGLLPRNVLIVFHVPCVIYCTKAISIKCSSVDMRNSMPNELDVTGPLDARMKNVVKILRCHLD